MAGEESGHCRWQTGQYSGDLQRVGQAVRVERGGGYGCVWLSVGHVLVLGSERTSASGRACCGAFARVSSPTPMYDAGTDPRRALLEHEHAVALELADRCLAMCEEAGSATKVGAHLGCRRAGSVLGS